jgi:hypothetical protein
MRGHDDEERSDGELLDKAFFIAVSRHLELGLLVGEFANRPLQKLFMVRYAMRKSNRKEGVL